MQMTWSLALTLTGAVAIGPAVASAQLSRPNGSGAAIGHVHINARDIEAQSRFWTTLGGRIIQREKLTLVQFPGIYVILRKQEHISVPGMANNFAAAIANLGSKSIV